MGVGGGGGGGEGGRLMTHCISSKLKSGGHIPMIFTRGAGEGENMRDLGKSIYYYFLYLSG